MLGRALDQEVYDAPVTPAGVAGPVLVEKLVEDVKKAKTDLSSTIEGIKGGEGEGVIVKFKSVMDRVNNQTIPAINDSHLIRTLGWTNLPDGAAAAPPQSLTRRKRAMRAVASVVPFFN